jgi:hypothetical protein
MLFSPEPPTLPFVPLPFAPHSPAIFDQPQNHRDAVNPCQQEPLGSAHEPLLLPQIGQNAGARMPSARRSSSDSYTKIVLQAEHLNSGNAQFREVTPIFEISVSRWFLVIGFLIN